VEFVVRSLGGRRTARYWRSVNGRKAEAGDLRVCGIVIPASRDNRESDERSKPEPAHAGQYSARNMGDKRNQAPFAV